MKYYAIAKGRDTGIYKSWDEAKPLVEKYKGAIYKSFQCPQDAVQFMKEHGILELGDFKSETIPHSRFHRDGCMYYNDRYYIYTDGGVSYGKGIKKSQCGIFFGDGHSLNSNIPIYDKMVTNQRAELLAIQNALELIKTNIIFNDRKIIICTDSEYSYKCLTKWYKGWENNDWKTLKGEDVKHRNILENIMKNVNNHGDIKFKHVRAHKDEPNGLNIIQYMDWYGNYQSDRLTRI